MTLLPVYQLHPAPRNMPTLLLVPTRHGALCVLFCIVSYTFAVYYELFFKALLHANGV